MAERREVAESALKALCDEMGVAYTTESAPVEGAWLLSTVTRGRVNLMAWSLRDGRRGMFYPLGSSQSQNLTHEQVYDQCWFAFWVIRRQRERQDAAYREALPHQDAPH
jgi:hypothetical protein